MKIESAAARYCRPQGERLRIAGLFAGIGGIELGQHEAGHSTEYLCENDPGAVAVLKRHFPDIPLGLDIRDVKALPNVDVIAAGFPCQDLSQAGRTQGITGKNSNLVTNVFRLIDARRKAPRWLLLENVPFMLQLDRGKAMRYVVDELEARRFTWAYRVVDTRSFGVPQRRQRVILIASRTEDPRDVLMCEDAGPAEYPLSRDFWCGFYWTEGLRGLGWAVNAVPTLKGGSGLGIPSPPGVWNPHTRSISTPEIRDAERLQGFAVDWTLPALECAHVRRGHRWKLTGNAVSVPVSRWVGERLGRPGSFDRSLPVELLARGISWPKAAWGHKGKVYSVKISMWPIHRPAPNLSDFLQFPLTPLSTRAASGFYRRAMMSGLWFEEGFLEDVRRHAEKVGNRSVA